MIDSPTPASACRTITLQGSPGTMILRLSLFQLVVIVLAQDNRDYDRRNRVQSSLLSFLNPLTSSLRSFVNPTSMSLSDHYSLPTGYANPMAEYDFIVIGAGSAGSAIASRLSENKEWSVLLLEAGGAESFISDIPGTCQMLQATHYNWGYKMEPTKGNCMGMKNQQCAWPRGKGIGGSSIINYMIYTRGHRYDWDRVAEVGNPGWSWNEVLPYFMKSEMANFNDFGNSSYHNRDGLLSIEYPKYRSQITKKLLKAARELNQNVKQDYNDGEPMGFSYVQAHTYNGVRHSAARAYLYPFRKRTNLHIYPYSSVTKININQFTKMAESVEFVRNKKKFIAKAKKEIILSAGALNSPQLLMLSGIGPKDHLNELGIEVINDLKVGETINDHVCFPGLAFLMNVTGMGLLEEKILGDPQNFIDWLRHGEGPFSVIGGVEGMGFIRTKVSDGPLNYPDLEYMFLGGCFGSSGASSVKYAMNIEEDFFDGVYGDLAGKPCWTVIPMLLHPRSKGRLRLKDKNPFHWPKFHYDYFADGRDLDTLVEGIKFAVKLSGTSAFQKYGSRLHDRPFPQCRQHTFGSDEYWRCAARVLGTTMYHQMSTCKMGPSWDPDAVVDNELRVYGIKGLRVGDASVIPITIGAHTNAPSIMIGEKLADMIKRTWS